MNLAITMDVTNRCNSRCKMCYFSLPGFKPKGRDMTLDEFLVVKEKLRKHAGRLAISCEFEPLLHPDIMEIIRACSELSSTWEIRLNTNGILLSESVSRALVESGISEIYVSIDAPTSEMNARIRGTQTLPRIKTELKRLAEIKKELGPHAPVCILRSTAMRVNLQTLPDMIDLCAEVGAERFSIKHLLPIAECEWEGQPMAEQSCLLVPEETQAVFDIIRNRATQMGVVVDLPPASPRDENDLRIACGYVDRGFHIYPDGTCYPCVWLTTEGSYGNIFSDTVEQVYDSNAHKQFVCEFKSPKTSAHCLACLRDSQTIGLKKENNARERLEPHSADKGQ